MRRCIEESFRSYPENCAGIRMSSKVFSTVEKRIEMWVRKLLFFQTFMRSINIRWNRANGQGDSYFSVSSKKRKTLIFFANFSDPGVWSTDYFSVFFMVFCISVVLIIAWLFIIMDFEGKKLVYKLFSYFLVCDCYLLNILRVLFQQQISNFSPSLGKIIYFAICIFYLYIINNIIITF